MKLDYRPEALHMEVRVSHGEPCHWLSSCKLSISVWHTSRNCSSIVIFAYGKRVGQWSFYLSASLRAFLDVSNIWEHQDPKLLNIAYTCEALRIISLYAYSMPGIKDSPVFCYKTQLPINQKGPNFWINQRNPIKGPFLLLVLKSRNDWCYSF